MPFKKTIEWIDKEKSLGSANPDRIVLATSGKDAIPHSRIVAIKEIDDSSLLFFTQLWTRKAQEIKENPVFSGTIWLPLQQREIIIDGSVDVLSKQENESYWKRLPRENQLRFSSYAPISGQPIDSTNVLNEKLNILSKKYENMDIPVEEVYCGYRLIPKVFYFYTLKSESFSEYIKYELKNGVWQQQLLSP